MHKYEERKFNLPELKGLSQKQVDVHLGLYGGYVKHVNLMREKLVEMRETDPEKNAYLIAELRRRFAFEFDGMRMHEYYFEQFEGGSLTPSATPLADAATQKYGSWDGFIEHIKHVGTTRGIGWVTVYHDKVINELHTVYVGDHELGQLSGLPIILALDMWEHAYMVDYTPAEKAKYIEAFLSNLNWKVVEDRFVNVS